MESTIKTEVHTFEVSNNCRSDKQQRTVLSCDNVLSEASFTLVSKKRVPPGECITPLHQKHISGENMTNLRRFNIIRGFQKHLLKQMGDCLYYSCVNITQDTGQIAAQDRFRNICGIFK
jgi:hypothetical protein